MQRHAPGEFLRSSPLPVPRLRQNNPTGKTPLNMSGKSALSACPVSPDERGGSRSSRTCGGMRWTRWRRQTNAACCVRRSRVVLTSQWLASSLRSHPQATETTKPDSPGRARYKPSNHCAGKAGLPPLNLYARVRFFRTYCTRDRGCSAHPVFPAPSCFRRAGVEQNSGKSCRENADACLLFEI